VILTVTPPVDAWGDDFAIVTITGRCLGDSCVHDEADTWTVVSTLISLEISANRTNAFVNPGDTADFVLTIWNHGNMYQRGEFTIETSPGPDDWEVSLDANVVKIAGEEYASVMLSVSAPLNATVNSSLVVTASCSDAGKVASAECNVTVTVMPVHSVSVSITPEMARMDPGGMTDCWFNITNTGNIDDDFRLGLFALPAGWSILFDLPDGRIIGETDRFTLHAHHAIVSHAVIASAFDAPAGDYHLSGDIQDGAGLSYPLELRIRVNLVHGLYLNATILKQSGSPGKAVAFPLTAINLGNGPEVVQLESSAVPAGWCQPLFRDEHGKEDGRLDLNGPQSVRMMAIVLIPAITPLGGVDFTVTASSLSGYSASVYLSVRIDKAELVITYVKIPSSGLHVGRPVTLDVTVVNRGIIGAGNVTVAFHGGGGDVRLTQNLGNVSAGAEEVFSFTWIPEKGRNILKFTVDPDDSVCESDETNNNATIERTIVDDSVSISANNPWPIIIATVATVGAILFIGVRRNAKARRDS
jgi:hypothetical protein